MLTENINITVGQLEKLGSTKLNVRQSLDGHLMLFDHQHLDIIIIPDKGKLIAFAKDIMDDDVYPSQDRLFKFLVKKGIVTPESIHAGNVYTSMESTIQSKASGPETLKIVLYNLSKFIEQEREMFSVEERYEKDREKELLEPSDEDSTDLGEVEESPKKGSVNPLYGGYGSLSMYHFSG